MSNLLNIHEPVFFGNESKYLKDCIDSGWVSSAGAYVGKLEESISKFVKAKYCVAVINGTAALELALRSLNVVQDSEVIVPSLTFIAPVNTISYLGAHPIFMDSDEFFNIDPEKTIDFIKNQTYYKSGRTYNKKTKRFISAIMPVHIFGNPVEYKELYKICKQRNISIIEDASEALGSFYINPNKHAGTNGDVGCLSFNGNKIVTSGGGGMVFTNNYRIAKKMRYLSTQAKDDPIKYVHNEIGYNFRLTNLQAAVGLAQIEGIKKILLKKRRLHSWYKQEFKKLEGVSLCESPLNSKSNFWLNVVRFKKEGRVDQMLKFSKSSGFATRPVWKLNHLQKPYMKCQNYNVELGYKLANTSICLPSSMNLQKKDTTFISKKFDVFLRS
tara:strand:+ start:1772 stop:2926 length:1155 start_codon:yes stop_codon:yes gene_type:complete